MAYIQNATPKPAQKDMLQIIKISRLGCIVENSTVPAAKIKPPIAAATDE